MPSFRRARYLSCFYCGRKTSTAYQAGIRQFECPNCDATNYLDKDGEITDPPASVTKATTPSPAKYTFQRTNSPPSSPPSGSIFCNTCLKNQHLVAASLAQYLPEDPNAPDYEELERKYYRFRKGLEQRYPQICPQCEPLVQQRLEQAAYTAKTDVLRRMIDNTQQNRAARTGSLLGFFDSVGQKIWIAALALHLLWHASVLYMIAGKPGHVENNLAWLKLAITSFGFIVNRLPGPESLIQMSLWFTIGSLWWNPRFTQTVRGFTKHLVGLRHWYIYQALFVLIRLASWLSYPRLSALTAQRNTQFAGHLLLAVFVSLVSKLAWGSIRVDATPLFGTPSPPSVRVAGKGDAVEVETDDGKKSMSQILDEILGDPIKHPDHSRHGRILSPPNLDDYIERGPPRGRDLGVQMLKISDGGNVPFSTNGAAAQYDEKMDWSPTHSKHRAFNSYRQGPEAGQGFSQAPTEPQKGHFWYRVPPAPTTPAQRVFNPPNQPRLRKNPVVDNTSAIAFRGRGSKVVDGERSTDAAGKRQPVNFAQPSFFSQPVQHDPRNTLTDLFTDGLNLNPSEPVEPQSWVGSLAGYVYPKRRQ